MNKPSRVEYYESSLEDIVKALKPKDGVYMTQKKRSIPNKKR